MLSNKKLFSVFLPAILIVALTLAIRIIQYEPLDGEGQKPSEERSFSIPISPADPIVGMKQAPITLIAFEDFGCEHCKAFSTLFDALEQKYPGKIKIIWKMLPVTRFPYDTRAAHQYGYCANQQKKFNEWKDLAFANSGNLSSAVLAVMVESLDLDTEKFEECLTSGAPDQYLASVEALARSLDIQAVPTIFIDNKQIQPPQLLEEWETLLGLRE